MFSLAVVGTIPFRQEEKKINIYFVHFVYFFLFYFKRNIEQVRWRFGHHFIWEHDFFNKNPQRVKVNSLHECYIPVAGILPVYVTVYFSSKRSLLLQILKLFILCECVRCTEYGYSDVSLCNAIL